LRTVKIQEFVPPIFFRLRNYVKKRVQKRNGELIRYHPFDEIPENIDVSWVLDIGANVGDVAIAALESYPDSQVVCFEPVASTFKILKNNLNSFANRTYLYNVALSDEEKDFTINITTTNGANSISSQTDFHRECNPHVQEIGQEEIHLVPLDSFMNQLPNTKFNIVKIDVEGHELEVLKGGISFFSDNVDVIIIEISFMRDPSWSEQAVFKIFAFLDDIGFCLVNIVDPYHVKHGNLLLTQMDCVFRHRRSLI